MQDEKLKAEIAAAADDLLTRWPTTYTVGSSWKYAGRLTATKALYPWSRWDRRAIGIALAARGPSSQGPERPAFRPKPRSSAPPSKAGPRLASPTPVEMMIRAPIAGIVVKLLVEVGDLVTNGDDVIVVNAMKMENLLPTPIDGLVKTIAVAPGARVARGETLLIIAGGPA
jgi:biotin carboxyl carrier protein